MAWCFEDEADPYADAVLDVLRDGRALVPALWPYEVANVLVASERRRRLRRADSTGFLELLAALPLEIQRPEGVSMIGMFTDLGREFHLSAYDLAYLALAMRERLPLATRDTRLRATARAAGVAYLVPKPGRR
jgi:predicted nucleic acid-binding protein